MMISETICRLAAASMNGSCNALFKAYVNTARSWLVNSNCQVSWLLNKFRPLATFIPFLCVSAAQIRTFPTLMAGPWTGQDAPTALIADDVAAIPALLTDPAKARTARPWMGWRQSSKLGTGALAERGMVDDRRRYTMPAAFLRASWPLVDPTASAAQLTAGRPDAKRRRALRWFPTPPRHR